MSLTFNGSQIRASAGTILLLTFLFFSLNGCNPKPASEKTATAQPVQNGKLLNAEKIGVYDTAKLNRILNAELEEFLTGSPMPFSDVKGKYQTPVNSVTLYKLTYQSSSPDKDNAPCELTGLVAIPSQLAPGNPLISYQHGTVFSKNTVPSHLDESMETKLMVAQFGGQGYVVIGADYEGLGDSPHKHAYMIRRTTEQACMDMYTAAQEFLAQQKIQVRHIFTMGWSQGAYNNLIFLRRLEQANVPVVASATASTPSDLSYFISHAILNPRPQDAAWMTACFSNMLFAYEEYAGLDSLTAKAIKPEYLSVARDFYEFKTDFPTFLSKTAPSIVPYLNPAFIEEIRLGVSPLCQALNVSEGYRWKSKTPLRAYYGESDEAIPVNLGTMVIDYQAAMGKTNGASVNAGAKADHRGTYAVAVYQVKPWFDSMIRK